MRCFVGGEDRAATEAMCALTSLSAGGSSICSQRYREYLCVQRGVQAIARVFHWLSGTARVELRILDGGIEKSLRVEHKWLFWIVYGRHPIQGRHQ